jgi:hypothetical protein
VAQNDGVYDVTTGERRFPIAESYWEFSPDGKLLVVRGDGVYDVATGERRLAVEGNIPHFSPDSQLLVTDDWVYKGATGERRFAISLEDAGTNSSFNPDGTLLAVSMDGVYDVATGEYRFKIEGEEPQFSADGKGLIAHGDGVYDVATGQQLLTLAHYGTWELSPDETLARVYNDGVYDLTTGENLFPLKSFLNHSFPNNSNFNSDSTMLADTIAPFDLYVCALLGPADYPWPYRSGLVITRGISTLHSAPSNSASSFQEDFEGELVVFAQTTDRRWYQVMDSGSTQAWVSAEDVNVISMPEDVPIKNS